MTAKEAHEIMELWSKTCIRHNNTPVCLITMSNDGLPNVYSQYDKELLKKIFLHLSNDTQPLEKTIFDDQEN